MSLDAKSSKRFADAPRDKPRVERVEHANLERPGAQAHPRAFDWNRVGCRFGTPRSGR